MRRGSEIYIASALNRLAENLYPSGLARILVAAGKSNFLT